MAISRVVFRVGFDLSTDYDVCIDHDVVPVHVRVGCHTHITREDYLPTVKAQIGTVRYGRHPLYYAFPDPEIVEHFAQKYGIPLVGARFNRETHAVEYAGERPEAPINVWGGTTWINPTWEARSRT